MYRNSPWQGVMTMVVPGLDLHTFAAIPSRLARDLRPHATRAVDGVLDALPEDEGEGAPGRETVREVVAQSLEHFYDLVADPRPVVWERVAGYYNELGRRLSHDPLVIDRMHQLMFRSARALWHTLDTLAAVDLDEVMLGLVADAQFDFIEASSAVFAHSYRSQRPEDPEQRRRRRSRLAVLLLGERHPEPETIEELARQAGWPLPKTVAAAALSPRDGHHEPSLMVPEEVLVGTAAGTCLLIPAPHGPGCDRLLRPLLRDWVVAIGPTMPLARAGESLRWARDAVTLAERGVLPDEDVIVSTDHVPTLVIFQAGGLIDSAADTRLAPLGEVSPNLRERLMETLLALLESKFNATEAALRLHIHPQTVRYRARRLEQLFGDRLRDPRGCLELEMILHARLAGGRRRVPSATHGTAGPGPLPAGRGARERRTDTVVTVS